MGVRVRSVRSVLLVVVAASALVACSPSDVGTSKAAICTKAVGVIVVSEASDDAQRRLTEAQDAASTLRSLASQTSDSSLASALRNAASTAASGSSHWSPSRLKTWATQEQARFDAIRKACV